MKRETEEMLNRLIDRESHLQDPMYNLQVKMVRQMLSVLEEALRSTHLDHEEIHEVLERFVFGCLPSAAQSEYSRKLQEQTQLKPATIAVGNLPEAFREAAEEGRSATPAEQVQFGLDHIARNYGTPEAARRFGQTPRS